MASKQTVEVWLVIDESGNVEVACDDRDAAAERYDETHGADSTLGKRFILVTLNVPLPEPIEVTAEIGDAGETVGVTVK